MKKLLATTDLKYSPCIALAAGILMGLAPAPLSGWWLAWIALVPLWGLIVTTRSGLRTALCQGLMWGIGYHGLALFWITGIHPMTWMGVNWWASLAIAVLVWIFVTLWGAAIVVVWAGLFSILGSLVQQRSWFPVSVIRVLIGTALWCSLEELWSQGPLYWSGLAYTQSPTNLAILHLGQISGPLTITATIVTANGLIAEAWVLSRQQNHSSFCNWKYLRMGIGVGVTAHLIGLALYLTPLMQSPETALTVGIIQGNIPNQIKLYEEGRQRAFRRYTKGYQAFADQSVDAVLTPEVALPLEWAKQNQINSSFYKAILDENVTVWVGAFGRAGKNLTNSLFTVGVDGRIVSEYRKVKLVPLGEYVPFKRWSGGLVSRLSPLEADLAAGQPDQLFNTPFGRAIVGICYESAFSEHFRRQAALGGQFILTASNNAHYSSAMPAQHHAQDVMRAIETDRWAARATNTGYSGIVDPHGRTLWLSGLNTYELHSDTIYRRQTRTLYVRFGNWLNPSLGVIGLIALLFGVLGVQI